MWPETTDTAPNSPTARAVSRTTPCTSPQEICGSVTRRNICQPLAPSATAASSALGALLLHHGDQLARHERDTDEHRREHDARKREDDLDVVRGEPRAEAALRAEQQHEDQAGNHRRHRERQVDQRDSSCAGRGT